MSVHVRNPILPGFHPDPSICRVGEDFYIACSSFSYFPGVPLFHSKDLAHWESIGYALDRTDQLCMNCEDISGGIFAPTLRYHDGLFYIIVGNVSKGETLLVMAKDPAGDWSDVHKIEDVGGDPSLFWDSDGTCWCTYNNADGIFQRRLNLQTYTLEGEEHFLWRGASANPWSPEASHVYQKDGWYYLIIAEGGTEHYHAVCAARSRSVNGPYSGYIGNPILTHRHLSMYYPICNIGHADIVDTPAGDWYMVMLGSRLIGGYHKNMGRETFLCPVRWENDWPVAAPDTGKVEWEYEIPSLSPHCFETQEERDDFDAPALSNEWNYLGTPANRPAYLKDGKLYIRALPYTLFRTGSAKGPMPDFKDPEAVAAFMEKMKQEQVHFRPYALGFVGRRQEQVSFSVKAAMKFHPKRREAAGLIVLQDGYNHIRIELVSAESCFAVRVIQNVNQSARMEEDILPKFPKEDLSQGETLLGEIPFEKEEVILQILARGQSYTFYAGEDEAHMLVAAQNVDAGFLGSETCGGFVGAYIGMFATSNGEVSDNEAAFDYFSCRGIS